MPHALAPRPARAVVRATLAALLCVGLVLMGAPAHAASPIVVPVAADDWADGRGVRQMPIFQSLDLVDWRYVGDVFGQRPAWQPAGTSTPRARTRSTTTRRRAGTFSWTTACSGGRG